MEFLSMIMLALVVIAGVVLLVLLLGLPGYIARRRGHEAAKAIHLCGLLGGLFFFPLWIVALVWAYTGQDRGIPEGEPSYHYGTPQRAKSLGPASMPTMKSRRERAADRARQTEEDAQ